MLSGMKICPICTSQVKGFSKSPTNCIDPISGSSIEHLEQADEKACNECWEAYISFEIERIPRNPSHQAKGSSGIECQFCHSLLSTTELKRLCRKDTFLRYELKLQASTKMKCQDRCQGTETPYQDINGRIFTCNICSFSTCVDCDVPEHPPGQSCSDYQRQLQEDTMHQKAERLTSREYRRCPNCRVPFTMENGCGYVQCIAGTAMAIAGVFGGCGFRFCAKCLIPWVGEGSDYLCGKTMHGEGCRYHRKEKPSMYSLKRRFDVARSDGKVDGGPSSTDEECWDFSEKKLKMEPAVKTKGKRQDEDWWDFSAQKLKVEPVVKVEGNCEDEECRDFSEQVLKVEPVVKCEGKDVGEGLECWNTS